MIPNGTTPDGERHELAPIELAAWRGMLRVTHRLRRELGEVLTREHGLSMADYDALVTLVEAPAGGMRLAELAEKILQPRSSLTRLIGSLRDRRLVTRDPTPDDGRGARASLTRAGLELYQRAHRTHLAGIRSRFLDHLEQSQVDQLAAVWDAVGLPAAQMPDRTTA